MTTAPNTANDRWTIGRLLSWTAEYFDSQGLDDARLSAEVLLAHVIECKRIDLYARFELEPDQAQTTRFRQLLKRAADHEPIAYLVGEKEFFSLPFHVTPDVLIPRGETETLVECVIDYCRSRAFEPTAVGSMTRPTGISRPTGMTRPTILDIGTGSGCMPIAILSQLEQATAVATDISVAALEVARKNADRHGLSGRITLVEADRLALPPDVIPQGGFDIIISNPPYVAAGDMDTLDKNVRDYEPHAALSDNDDGLSFYKTIAAGASKILCSTGIVFVEIADGQEHPVRDTMTRSNRWQHRGTWRDNITENPRVLAFSKSDED